MITTTEFQPVIVPNVEKKSRKQGVWIGGCNTDESMMRNHVIQGCFSSWFSGSIRDLIGQDRFDKIYDDDRGAFHLNGVFVTLNWIELEFWEHELVGRHQNYNCDTTLTIRLERL